jgi:hypothetical protein
MFNDAARWQSRFIQNEGTLTFEQSVSKNIFKCSRTNENITETPNRWRNSFENKPPTQLNVFELCGKLKEGRKVQDAYKGRREVF